MRSRTATILLGIIALGSWLRIQSLGAKSLWYNESDSSCFLELPMADVLTRSFEPRAVHPPLYHLVLHGWAWAWGGSDCSLRSLAVTCGIVAVLGVYFLTRELCAQSPGGGTTSGALPVVALLAASLVALSPLQAQLSRQVRGYSMASMFLIWGGWALLRATRNDGRPVPKLLWPATSLLALLACYTHHMAILSVAAQGLYAVARLLQDRGEGAHPGRLTRPIAAASLFAVGYLAIGCPALLAQGRTIRRDYLDPIGLWQAIGEMSLTLTATAQSDPRVDGVTAWVAAGLAIAGVGWLAWLGLRGGSPGLYLALTGLLPLLAQVAFSIASDRSVVKARYLSFAQVSWLVALTWTVALVRGRAARAAVASWLVGFSALCSYASWPILGQSAFPGMRVAVATALERRSPGELVITADPTTFCGIRHYTRGFCRSLLLVAERSRLAQRGSEHLLDEQLTTVGSLEASRPSGLWIFSNVSNQFGKPELFERLPGRRLAGRWIFEQDYYAEPPLILEHYEFDGPGDLRLGGGVSRVQRGPSPSASEGGLRE